LLLAHLPLPSMITAICLGKLFKSMSSNKNIVIVRLKRIAKIQKR